MAGTIFGNNSRDGYYWGYVGKYKRLMQFEDRDAYLEYISELNDNVTEPYWKQQGSYLFHKNNTSYNEEVENNETKRT